MWEVQVQVPVPSAEPELDRELDREVLTGDLSSYRACQEEAHRLRDAGHSSLRAPSAVLLLGHAELYCVVGGAESATGHLVSERFVSLWPPKHIAGMALAEGHPDPTVLADVRHLCRSCAGEL